MKFLIIFVAIFAVALAAPVDNVETLRQTSDVQPDHYNFVVETSDGKVHHEEGVVKDIGSDHAALSVLGTFSWKDSDGHVYTVTYTADEHGFHPEGTHLPQQPKYSDH